MENVFASLLRKNSEELGDKTALNFENQHSVTYHQLNEITDLLAHGLSQLGVTKDSKVAMLMPNSLEIIYSWLALSKIGAVEVPINTANRGEFLSYIINNSHSTILIIDEEYLERFLFIMDDLEELKHVIIRFKEGARPTLSMRFDVHSFEDIVSTNDGLSVWNEVRRRDAIAMIYTSGTTGPSKGVLYPVGQAMKAAEEYLASMGCTREDIFFTCLPLFHGNAQFLCVLAGFISGSTVYIYERFSASKFWNQIAESRATIFNSLGAMASFIYNQPVCKEEKINTVRACMAAPMPVDIFSAFESRFGLKVIEGYGLTETGMITYNPWQKTIVGSCGKATENYEVFVVDEEDNILGPNTIGEIVARSKEPWTMCLGYYKMAEKTVEAFRNFFFHTGDAGLIDKEGYLYFKDRVKDYIRRRGENISSFEVERVFLAHSNIAECAAIAVQAEHSEDEVMVVIVTKDGQLIPYEELMAYCVQRMPYFAVPRYVLFENELPKTANEKIRKDVLRKQGITTSTWDRERAGYKISR